MSFAARAEPPPVSAFAQLPAIHDPLLSPDGRYLAAVERLDGQDVASIYQIGASSGAHAILPPEGWRVSGVAWVKSDRLLIQLSRTQTARDGGASYALHVSRSIIVSPDGGNTATLFDKNGALNYALTLSRPIDIALNDPLHVYVPLAVATATRFVLTLQRVDVRTGDGDIVVQGNGQTRTWIMDGQGNLAAQIDAVDTQTLQISVRDGDDWRPLAKVGASSHWWTGPISLSPDGGSILRIDDDLRTVSAIDLKSGAEKNVFRSDFDIFNYWTDGGTRRLVGIAYLNGKLESAYFDPDWERLQSGLEKAFAGKTVFIASLDQAKKIAAVHVEDARTPPSMYLVDRASGQATEILQSYPALGEVNLAEMKSHDYQARDGLKIPAYLILPVGKPARNLPLVVMPPSEPDDPTILRFEWMAQFIASRGYAVLLPNPRGSVGYGRAFEAAGEGEWGGKINDDIVDGVQRVAAEGIADPKRVCIVGGGMGGYEALATATMSPGVFACAASIDGLSDPAAFLSFEARLYGGVVTRIGPAPGISSYFKSLPTSVLEQRSPIEHAADAAGPILLLHAANDWVIPVSQSENMASALKKAHRDVRFVTLEDDDNSLSREQSRTKILTELNSFLNDTIGR